MKLLSILGILLLSSCSNMNGIGNKLFPSKDYSKNGCNGAPVKIANLEDKKAFESKNGIVTNYYISPRSFGQRFGDQSNDYDITIEIVNNTRREAEVIWQKSSYMDFSGSSQKLLTAGTMFVDKNKEQPTVTIPPSGKISTSVYPSNYVFLQSGKWYLDHLKLGNHVGEKFGIYTNINGKGKLVQFEVCEH